MCPGILPARAVSGLVGPCGAFYRVHAIDRAGGAIIRAVLWGGDSAFLWGGGLLIAGAGCPGVLPCWIVCGPWGTAPGG